MLIRFGALAALVGLGLGAILRVALGRRRFGTLLVIAHLPILYHLVRVALAGVDAGLPNSWTLAFVGAGLLLMLLGIAFGRAAIARRPLLAAATPLIVLAVQLLGPTLIYNGRLAQAVVSLDSLATFAYALATIFFVATLVPFVPPPVSGPRLPRLPWQR